MNVPSSRVRSESFLDREGHENTSVKYRFIDIILKVGFANLYSYPKQLLLYNKCASQMCLIWITSYICGGTFVYIQKLRTSKRIRKANQKSVFTLYETSCYSVILRSITKLHLPAIFWKATYSFFLFNATVFAIFCCDCCTILVLVKAIND